MGIDLQLLPQKYRDQISKQTSPVALRLPHALAKQDAGKALRSSPDHEERSSKRVVVRITRFAATLVDFDNGAGGCKYLVDAMRYKGLISDDSPEHIDFQFRQVRVKSKAEFGTEILIEEIP